MAKQLFYFNECNPAFSKWKKHLKTTSFVIVSACGVTERHPLVQTNNLMSMTTRPLFLVAIHVKSSTISSQKKEENLLSHLHSCSPREYINTHHWTQQRFHQQFSITTYFSVLTLSTPPSKCISSIRYFVCTVPPYFCWIFFFLKHHLQLKLLRWPAVQFFLHINIHLDAIDKIRFQHPKRKANQQCLPLIWIPFILPYGSAWLRS